ncbi:MAG: TlpA family protein disulfide reductase [Cytophagaceae bacterium]|nr:TlpA family protein disulfide reductase [Cytophagaceae bacterium]
MKIFICWALLMGLIFFQGDVEVIKWAALEEYMDKKEDKIKVINFWATWCKPCMDELPYFEQIHEEYKDKNIEVLLVSLDQASMKDKVKASLKKNNVTAKAVLLDEVDFNKWINLVDTTWSGSIPATLIISKNNTSKTFYERQFTKQQLEELIHSLKP